MTATVTVTAVAKIMVTVTMTVIVKMSVTMTVTVMTAVSRRVEWRSSGGPPATPYT